MVFVEMVFKKNKKNKSDSLSIVTKAFLADHDFIKKFLSQFFSSQHDIEDVAQEAYLRAFAAEQKKDGDIEQPRAFLFRIAKNIAVDRLRRKSRQITDYIEDLSVPVVIEDGTDPEREMEGRQSLGIYCEAVASLPDKCRQVFLLRKVHGLKHKEIADRLSISVSSVEKHLRRGMAETRAHLRQQDGEAPAKQAEADRNASLAAGKK